MPTDESPLAPLAAAAGRWRGTSTLQDPMTNTADQSASEATIAPVLGGRFMRFDYIWAYHGTPQEGSLLIGHEAQRGGLTAHWIDSWHMSDAVMACEGTPSRDRELSLRGSYAVPTGPDWGWRIVLQPSRGELRVLMYNIDPAGTESPVVEARYEPA